MPVRAKFKCTSKTPSEHDDTIVETRFDAVYGDGTENKEWTRWTPSGALTLQVTNPEANAQFEVGKEYFLDISPA